MTVRSYAHLILFLFFATYVSVLMVAPFPHRELVLHALEGGLVGALADWFAVTALFRRPLGIPFPHSAIIVRKQRAIAEQFGMFVEEKFLHRDVIAQKLLKLSISKYVARFLQDGTYREQVSVLIAKSMLALRTVFFTPALVGVVSKGVTDAIRSYSLDHLLTVIKSIVTTEQYFHPLSEKLIQGISRILEDEKDEIRTRVKKSLPWFVPSFIDEKLYEMLIKGMRSFMQEIAGDTHHPFRTKLREKLTTFVTSPESRSMLDGIRQQLLSSPQWVSFLEELMLAVKEKDITPQQEALLAAALDEFLASMSHALLEHQAALGRVESMLQDLLLTTSQYGKHLVRELITDTLNSWDSKTLVSSIEESIGEDLQYIRINGTVLGALLGAMLYLLQQFVV